MKKLLQMKDILRSLHLHLRKETKEKYNRINPFCEDLFDWKERGSFWLNEDKNVTVYNSTTIAGDVKIGENSWIGPFCSLDGSGGLSIGKNCSVSLGCQLITHDTVKWALTGGKAKYEYAPVKIGDCCFLGVHSVIPKGITLGNHCLVAAGAIVTRDFPSFSIIAGVPAKKIGEVEIMNGDQVKMNYFKKKKP